MTNHKSSIINHKSLTIGWLYPTLMNIYGDRGNVTVLEKRCAWIGIHTKVLRLNIGFTKEELEQCDILLMGGAQDKQQEAVANDLFEKQEQLKTAIEKGIPGIYVCGAYQMLGNYYKEANGNRIKGLGIFDLYTENPGPNHKRLIGNIAVKINDSRFKINENEINHKSSIINRQSYVLVGFENHGGRTYLGKNMEPFGKVIQGFGNNGEDKTEGIFYKNSIGTYLHGPLLPKNPLLADYIISSALKIKYHTKAKLKPLENNLEDMARKAIAKRLSVAI